MNSHRIKELFNVAKQPKSRLSNDDCCSCPPFQTIFDPNTTDRDKNDVNSAWGVGETVTFTLKKDGVVTSYTPTAVQFPRQTDAFYTTIEWRDVYFLDGIGCYELYVNYSFAGLTDSQLWGKFDLQPYDIQGYKTAQGTVRLFSIFNDVNNSIDIDFTDAFVKDTLRFKGQFGYWNDNTEVDNIQYTDAERTKVKREDLTDYELRIDLHGKCIIERLRFHLLSENACFITDHNEQNYDKYIDLPVIVKEGFVPSWEIGTKKVSGVAKFQDKQKLKITHFKNNIETGAFNPPTDAFIPAQITDGDEVVQVGSGQTYTCIGTETKDIFIKGIFASGNDTMESLTIDSDTAGTFTSITDDGASGSITLSKNGGSFVAFSSPLVLASTDTLVVKRTVTSAIGNFKLIGTYV
jgi:hypothetical protein